MGVYGAEERGEPGEGEGRAEQTSVMSGGLRIDSLFCDPLAIAPG